MLNKCDQDWHTIRTSAPSFKGARPETVRRQPILPNSGTRRAQVFMGGPQQGAGLVYHGTVLVYDQLLLLHALVHA